jgi:hypothetical protein
MAGPPFSQHHVLHRRLPEFASSITVDGETLKRARIKALEQGTSVNALLREYLDSYVGTEADRERRRQELEDAWEIARKAGARSGGITWKREDLYDREAMRRDMVRRSATQSE